MLTTNLFHRQSKDAALSRALALRWAMLVLIGEGRGMESARSRSP